MSVPTQEPNPHDLYNNMLGDKFRKNAFMSVELL